MDGMIEMDFSTFVFSFQFHFHTLFFGGEELLIWWDKNQKKKKRNGKKGCLQCWVQCIWSIFMLSWGWGRGE